MVTMHDINLALRFASKFLFLKNGEIYAAGGHEVITPENIEKVYSIPVRIDRFEDVTVVTPV